MLQTVKEKMLVLPQEGRFQHARRAYSWTLKGVLLSHFSALLQMRRGVTNEISQQFQLARLQFHLRFTPLLQG